MGWSVEQRKAASERMRARMAAKRGVVAEVSVIESQAEVVVVEKPIEVVAEPISIPEVLKPTVTVVPLARTMSREYRIIANTDGKMVCESGPCLCGAGKREWHDICLKQK
jgi:hypothetical protein